MTLRQMALWSLVCLVLLFKVRPAHTQGANERRLGGNTEAPPKQTVFSALDAIGDPFSNPGTPRSGGGGGSVGGDCGSHDISQCTELLEVLTRKEIGFAATQDDLNQMCPVLLKGLYCIDNYTRLCLNPRHRSYFNQLYAGTIRVIQDLCNDHGRYQKEYILHAPCMRRVHPEYNRCSQSYHEKTAHLNQVNAAVMEFSESERRRNVITLCCSFQEYLQCSERIVYETCGNATATFTKEFLNRMAGPIVETKCSEYKPGSNICIRAANSSPASRFSVSFFIGSTFFALFFSTYPRGSI